MTTNDHGAVQRQVNQRKLESYMHQNVEGFRGPLEVSEFTIGTSNPTFLLTTPTQKYVLRRKPIGSVLPSAHAVDREFRVLKALSGTHIPVPRPLALCIDESVLGSMFYIMEFVPGRIFTDAALPGMSRNERRAIYDAMNSTLAALHLVDYTAVGLSDYGRDGNYFARQIARWTKQYRASQTQNIPEMDRLIEVLPQRVPENPERTIVHGDFTLTNLIFHSTEPRVVAILDWELSTIGDPIADFTYNLMHWYMPQQRATKVSLRGIDIASLGIPSMEEYAEAYSARVGRSDVAGKLDFCIAYNLFRLAGLCQGTVHRIKTGNASHDSGVTSEELTARLARAGWEYLEKTNTEERHEQK